MNIARVPAVSPLPKAAKISANPATNAQIATIYQHQAGRHGPDQGDQPDRRRDQREQQAAEHRPVVALLNARTACRPAPMNA
jgi:hypothetical protein